MFFFVLALFGSAVAWGIYRNLVDERFVQAIVNSDLRNEDKIDNLVKFYGEKGYVVGHRSTNQVQLVRKKKFSFFWAIIWLLLFGFGVIIYLLYYMAKRDDVQTYTLPGEPGPKDVTPEPQKAKAKPKARARKGR